MSELRNVAVSHPTASASSMPAVVIDAIKRGLKNGELVPGQRLIEVELADGLSVSRQSVREALARLAAEGVVELERHRGARIRQFTRDEVVALHQIREVLEGLAAALAAGKDDEIGRDRLRLIQAEAAEAVAAEAREAFRDCNARFHAGIIEMSGNAEIKLHVSHARLGYFRLQSHLFLAADMVRSHGEHGQVLQAILDHDADAAERLMRTHIRSSRDAILRAPDSFFRPLYGSRAAPLSRP